ncbi:MAG: tRNA glutamyl-Q synthetase [Actinobacteria bacterium]|nr:tRNA glutamyl-Q synthetase [Actinomycetota bacterium]
MALTRYAPTPSGFLHAGNVANLERTAELARQLGAAVALRIDDADATRYRREYVDDIFRVLAVRGLDWDLGPRDTDDFEANFSQRRKTDYYREVLLESGLTTYACVCSRTTQCQTPTGGCVGHCRTAGHAWRPGHTALRVSVPPSTSIHVGGEMVRLDLEIGDLVIWRRDDLPAYQLVSVIEDRDLGTTHIVRGADLLASSAAQIFLARAIGADNVVTATYVHHALVVDAEGRKLSKSTMSSREGA